MAGESDREVVIPARRVASPQRWTKIERALRQKYGELLAGVDEVGRGPLAGPVVACAVIMPPNDRAIAGVDDSKLLPAGDYILDLQHRSATGELTLVGRYPFRVVR